MEQVAQVVLACVGGDRERAENVLSVVRGKLRAG
jgi:hypothetical protein